MFEHSWSRAGVALILAAGLAGCNGQPEDTGQSASSDTTGTSISKTPAPPYPAWADGMIGKNLSQVSHGTISCKGQVDTVTAKHVGVHPGSQIEGWAWDVKDARPMDKVVFVDSSNRIVGGAVEGNPRTDVKAAMPEIKTTEVGWRGVAGMTSGEVTAVGLADSGASCVLSTTTL